MQYYDLEAPAKYLQELDLWRKSRPEYVALCKAIRRDEKDHAVLSKLAADAGFLNLNKVLELQMLRRRALDQAERAKLGAEARKRLADIEAQWAKLDATLETAQTLGQERGVMAKFAELEPLLHQAKADVSYASVAESTINAAREAGLM